MDPPWARFIPKIYLWIFETFIIESKDFDSKCLIETIWSLTNVFFKDTLKAKFDDFKNKQKSVWKLCMIFNCNVSFKIQWYLRESQLPKNWRGDDSSRKMQLRPQASSVQADAQSKPQMSRQMLPIDCHASTCLDMPIHCHALVYVTCS